MTTTEPPVVGHPAVALDAVTAEIIRGNLVAIAEEMKTNLMRTAYNQIIYEAQDFTVGLFDVNGDTVSIGLGLPMFVGGLSRAVKAKIEHYGLGGIHPGDILLTNDAYIMGSHLNHLIFTLPIFAEGRIVAFASSMAHWLDVGGVLGGVTTDIYSEGLQLPIVKIFKAGVQDDELTRIIEMNVRFPEAALGDFRAQVAAVRTGETRVRGLVERYGAGVLERSFTAMFDRSEAVARDAVRRIPDGVYTAESFMDGDGVSEDPVRIKVTVRVSDDRMTIDLSEVGAEVAGYYNSGETAGHSAAHVAFKALTSPTEFPINEGSLRPVEVVLPPGRVISARRPRAMRWWMTYPMTVVDCILRALAPALGSAAIAGHHADLGITLLYGTDSETGRPFMFVPGPQGGGWGATGEKDGESATICINDGDTHNMPVEALEARFPSMRALRYELRTDSGGPGRHRGGLGTVQEWEIGADAVLDSFIERTRHAPWGIAGGLPALPNGIAVAHAGSEPRRFDSGKLSRYGLRAGDRLIVETGGGGGNGSPLDRPADAVLADIRAGYVSAAAAAEHYGVETSGESGQESVDEPSTRRRRGLRDPKA